VTTRPRTESAKRPEDAAAPSTGNRLKTMPNGIPHGVSPPLKKARECTEKAPEAPICYVPPRGASPPDESWLQGPWPSTLKPAPMGRIASLEAPFRNPRCPAPPQGGGPGQAGDPEPGVAAPA
jgi:hypothetical protein